MNEVRYFTRLIKMSDGDSVNSLRISNDKSDMIPNQETEEYHNSLQISNGIHGTPNMMKYEHAAETKFAPGIEQFRSDSSAIPQITRNQPKEVNVNANYNADIIPIGEKIDTTLTQLNSKLAPVTVPTREDGMEFDQKQKQLDIREIESRPSSTSTPTSNSQQKKKIVADDYDDLQIKETLESLFHDPSNISRNPPIENTDKLIHYGPPDRASILQDQSNKSHGLYANEHPVSNNISVSIGTIKIEISNSEEESSSKNTIQISSAKNGSIASTSASRLRRHYVRLS